MQYILTNAGTQHRELVAAHIRYGTNPSTTLNANLLPENIWFLSVGPSLAHVSECCAATRPTQPVQDPVSVHPSTVSTVQTACLTHALAAISAERCLAGYGPTISMDKLISTRSPIKIASY